MSGKTTYAKKKAKSLREQFSRPIIVLDPMNDPEWQVDFQTDCQREFLDAVWSNQDCAIFVDEAGSEIGKYNKIMEELATKGRHFGHKVYFITQRVKQLSTTIRTQCSELVIFKQSLTDTKDLADEFVEPMINQAHTLEKGEFILVRDNMPPLKANVFDL